MTSAEYRERAEDLLTGDRPEFISAWAVEQAAVWAQLATAAAISETAKEGDR
ncbi:hypothetical protein ACGFMM_11205 [Streptomyces sp. NPDC048604]|uniref:hypothetical protein n=1 Tax=Streptomyces sp. NPDC048604 TaxID=3365578 RepID=UPI00371883AE